MPDNLIKSVLLVIFVLVMVFSSVTSHAVSLKVGVYQNKPKVYLSEQKQAAGFFPEILNYIAEQEGWNLEYVPCVWNECLQKVEKGHLDLMLDVAYSDVRQKRFDFNQNVVLSNWSLVYAKEEDYIRNILDLDMKKLAVLKGSFQYRKIKEQTEKYGINPVFVEVASQHQVFELIENNIVDAGITNRLYGAQQDKNYDIYKTDIILFPSRLHYVATKGKHVKILKQIDQYIELLKADKSSIYYLSLSKSFKPVKRVIHTQVALTDKERSWIEEHPVIQASNEMDWPPFDFVKDGKPAGFSVDYLNLVARKSGFRINYVNDYDWSELLRMSRDKELDLVHSIVRTDEREKYLGFTRAYAKNPGSIFVHKNNKDITSFQDLRNKKVAVIEGFYTHEFLEQDYPGLSLLLVRNVLEGIRAVSHGQADAYIGRDAVVSYIARRNFIDDFKSIGGTGIDFLDYSEISFSVRNDWPILANILQKGMDAVTEEEYNTLATKWLSLDRKEVASKQVLFTNEERQWLAEHSVIDIGVDGNWPPIDFMDKQGNHSGIASDFIKTIGQRMGVKFNPVKANSFKDMLEKVERGELKVGSTISYKKERAEKLLFTQPFFQAKKVIIVPNNIWSINHIKDLKGKSVAVEDGFLTMRQLQEKHPEIKLVPVKNSLEALQQVSWGKADAYIGNQSVVSWLLRENQITNLHFVGEPELGSGPQNFAISKQAPSWLILKTIINKTLASITEKERYAIEHGWLGESGSYLIKAPEIDLNDDEKRWIKEHPLLRIGIDPLWPPVEYFDGQGNYQGMSSDVIADLANLLDMEIKVEKGLSWPQVHQKVIDGEIDVLPAVSPTKKRKEYLSFTRPYLEFPQVIFIHDETSFFLSGLDDLRGRSIAIEKGYVAEEKLSRDYPEIRLIRVNTTLDALELLALGKVDAYVGNLTIGSYLITEHGLSNIKVAAPTPFSNKLTMGVRKDWPELAPILQKALDSLGQAKMAEIRQKWMTVRYEHKVDYTLLWWVAGISLLVLALVLAWLGYTARINRVLHRGRERLRLTLESASLGGWELILKDLVPVKGSWNKYFSQHHNITDKKALGTLDNFYKNIDSEYVAKLRSSFNAYLTGKTKVFEQEYRTTDGRWILSQGRVFEYDEQGRPTRIIGTSRDITDHKQVQLERERVHALLVDAIESIDAAFIMFDASNRFVICNTKYKEVYPEITAMLIPGTEYADIFTRYCRLKKYNELTDQTIQEWVQEKLTIHQSHIQNKIELLNDRWVLSNDYETSDGGAVSLIYDVTELKNTQHALEKANAETELINNELMDANTKLKELDKLKSMFIASISHELRTPLNSIIGFSSMMVNESYGELNDKYKDYISRINNSGQHLLSLITDIIDISKIESGRIDLELSEFEINGMINEAVNNIRSQAESKGLVINVIAPDNIFMHSDKRRLLQCLLNLLSNAMKYSEQGTISLTVEQQDGEIVFSVQDTGIGIAKEDMPRLFEAFERMDSHLRVKAGGTGLGLYLTKKIVADLLQGKISAESTLGEGSLFWIKVPRVIRL